MGRTAGRKGSRYRTAQQRVYREETHCVLCGGNVDQTLSNPRHPMARSVQHLISPRIRPDLANDRANMRLAHYGCNSSEGMLIRGQLNPGGSRTTRRTPSKRGSSINPRIW